MNTETVAPEPNQTQSASPVVLQDLRTQPVALSTKNGSKKFIIKLDEVEQDDGRISLNVWATQPNVQFCLATSTKAYQFKTSHVARPDVEASLGSGQNQKITGYRLVADLPTALAEDAYLTFSLDSKLYAYKLPLKKVFSATWDITELPLENSTQAKAHIDLCGAIVGKVGALSGWSIAKPGVTLWLVDSKGNKKNLSTCLRYHRDDVAKIFSSEFSSQINYAGFVTDWPYPQEPADRIAVIEECADQFKLIALNSWSVIADDPVNYAKFSFSLATPAQDFDTRLNNWEGDVINSLIFERNLENQRNEQPITSWRFGKLAAEDVKTSVIIPLYGRWDFVEHQLSAFAKDPAFKTQAEIIYVIDDPALINAFVNEAESLFKLYQVPFTIIWGHRNRGFSGANNLGVKHSHGETLILLNSDVFPRHPGWVQALTQSLEDHPAYGMIGARLLFPDGSIQHCGMQFVFSESWNVWLNKHPLAGLDPILDQASGLTEKPAITGACVAIKRKTYEQIEGLDEGYLIGDFEDSDLCMKVHAQGLKIGYLPSVELTHLERQSFTLLGDVSYRTLVVRFNAWRHTKKWGKQIEQVMSTFGSEYSS
ncbi:glycosyltransferase [Pseudomonas putida]|uniref:glycosyltransferase family 2 protein n=1 Tax=Pseudomonas putida TaxID=303 RepID=UPI0018AB7CF8|nr:glycosyltransferase [Pseudomonas putida]MBF8651231.1 glycosyltransferase [Pseudomonas putida]MBF8654927.1 glycosyltransferase [Pseudomonas putida]